MLCVCGGCGVVVWLCGEWLWCEIHLSWLTTCQVATAWPVVAVAVAVVAVAAPVVVAVAVAAVAAVVVE